MTKLIKNALLAIFLSGTLSACWTAIGAAGGYVYAEESDKSDGDAD